MIIERFSLSLREWFGTSSRRDSTGNIKIRLPRWSTVFGLAAIRRFKSLGVSVLLALLVANPLIFSNAFAQAEYDPGNFLLLNLPVDGYDREVARVADWVDGPGKIVLDQVVDDLNEEFNLAQSVLIVFAPWAEIDEMAVENLANRPPGALFDRGGTDDIYISYEFMARILDDVDDDISAWYPNVINVVLHEVGHALIHVNDIALPQRGDGPERDAERDADEVSFFVLTEFYEAENEMREVAKFFWISVDKKWAEGNYDFPERADRYQCWIEGLLKEGSIHCVNKYEQLVDTWRESLDASWKGQFGEYGEY